MGALAPVSPWTLEHDLLLKNAVEAAIISLDKDGSFHMKNLGKSSIYVNDKVAAPGQTQVLPSSCLIEISGIPSIFEIIKCARSSTWIAYQNPAATRSNHL